MNDMAFRVGDRARFSFSFQTLDTNIAGDPPEVTVIHRDPAGVETVFKLSTDPDVVIRDSTGNYHADIRLMSPDTHYFRAVGTGDPELEKSTEISVVVLDTAFSNPLP